MNRLLLVANLAFFLFVTPIATAQEFQERPGLAPYTPAHTEWLARSTVRQHTSEKDKKGLHA